MKKYSQHAGLLIIALLLSSSGCAQPDPMDDYNLMINALDWSPDGEELIFTALLAKKDFSNMSPSNWTLYSLDISENTVTPVEKGILFATWSPSGDRIAYGKYHEGNWDVFVQTVSDKQVRRLTTHAGKDNTPSWSPDGTEIVFNSERAGGKQIFVMNADGTNKRQITTTDDPEIKSFNPYWSPVDNRIVYFLEKGDHMDQIYLTDSEGSFYTNLTDNTEHNIYPTWTPGADILYTAGSRDNQVYRMDVEGNTQPVEGVHGMYARQSPSSRNIAYIGDEEDGSKAIYLYDLETRSNRIIVDKSLVGSITKAEPYNDHDPRWSPDGSQVVFYSDRPGNFDIYIVNADGSGLRQLTDDPSYDGMPDWSPDGTRISFASNRDGDYEIYTMNLEGSDLTQLTHNEELDGTHRWSPDGMSIAFEGRRDGNADIFVMNSDGSGTRRVTTDPGNDAAPDWMPDGKTLIFQSSRSGTYQLYRIQADGTSLEQLTGDVSHNVTPSVSDDGTRIAFISHRTGTPQVFRMNTDGTDPRAITSSSENKMRAELSPDGRTILYNALTPANENIKGEIFIVNMDGSAIRNILSGSEN